MKLDAFTAVVALLGAAASTLPTFTQAQTLTPEQAHAIVAPFYRALNAGNDVIALVNEATSPDWLSCGGNECAGRVIRSARRLRACRKPYRA
jgi:hypothetical protein